MTAAVAPPLPTADELDDLIATAIQRVEEATKHLDLPLTVARVHVIKQHLTVVRGDLGTLQNLRAKGVSG